MQYTGGRIEGIRQQYFRIYIMNFFKNPEYASTRTLLAVVLVLGVGYGVYSVAGSSSNSFLGSALFATNNIKVTLDSANAVIAVSNPGDNNDIGMYEINFHIKAIGDDAYIAPTLSSNPMSYNNIYSVVNDSGTVFDGGGVTSLLTTSADISPMGRYIVYEGDVESFTVTVQKTSSEENPGGMYKTLLKRIRWNNDDSDTFQNKALDKNIFTTDLLNLN